MSDQDRISPYSINTISSKQVVRIKKYINLRIISWSNTKFSELKNKNCIVESKENYKFYLGVKGLISKFSYHCKHKVSGLVKLVPVSFFSKLRLHLSTESKEGN